MKSGKNIPDRFSTEPKLPPRNKENFLVPDLYFDRFPERLHSLLLLKKAPMVLPEETYFKTFPEKIKELTLQKKGLPIAPPDSSYSQNLQNAIQQKIQSKNKSGAWGFQRGILWGGFATAACLALILLLRNPNIPAQETLNQEITLASGDANYEESVSEYLDEQDLTEALTEEKTTQESTLTQTGLELRTEHIEEYLIEQNLDLQTIENEI